MGGGNPEESPGKEVEMLWSCDEKSRGLCREEGDGDRSARMAKQDV